MTARTESMKGLQDTSLSIKKWGKTRWKQHTRNWRDKTMSSKVSNRNC